MAGATPTQRTLSELKKRGWPAAVVEKWVPMSTAFYAGDDAKPSRGGFRKDVWGFIDILVLDGLPGSLAIQACGATGFAEHLRKIDGIEEVRTWLRAGNRLELWSWRKVSRSTGRPQWEAKAVPLVIGTGGRIITTYEAQAQQAMKAPAPISLPGAEGEAKVAESPRSSPRPGCGEGWLFPEGEKA